MTSHPDLTNAVWKKSTRSDGNGGQCVEVADLGVEGIAVRDSKAPAGAVLTFTSAEWAAFIEGAKAGQFDRPC